MGLARLGKVLANRTAFHTASADPEGEPCLPLLPLGAQGHWSCGPQSRAATKPSFSYYRQWLDVSFFLLVSSWNKVKKVIFSFALVVAFFAPFIANP